LDFPEFDPDRDQVVQRAKDNDVDFIINIGSSLQGSRKSIDLAKTHDFIYASVGLHPHEADKFDNKTEAAIKGLAREDKVVAIGETGLDYYKNYSQTDGSTPLTISPEWNRRTENQKTLFITLVRLAKDLGLPLVIHNRQAQEDVLVILKNNLPLKAVIHCFWGDEKFLKECLDLGFFVSFTCNITYKKSDALRNLVKITPLERLLLETDAPFLPPEGFRGKRNEPAYVKYLAEEIARIREIRAEGVAKITTENAKRFFNLR
jgi:TatD DNase family protein